MFNNGLHYGTKQMVNVVAGCTLMRKKVREAYDLTEEMAVNTNQYLN